MFHHREQEGENVMKPIEIACRHQYADLTNCGAGAGEPCVWGDEDCGQGVDAEGEPTFHAERVEDAAAVGEPGDVEISDEALDRVVDEMEID